MKPFVVNRARGRLSCRPAAGKKMGDKTPVPKEKVEKKKAEVAPAGHPLHAEWTMWYFENRQKVWEHNLIVVGDFKTVEGFWEIYHGIKLPSDLRSGTSMLMFRKGIKPMWEDPANKKGGRLLFQCHRDFADDQWCEVLMCLIGEAFDDAGDDVTGAAIDIRDRGNKISIWTADALNQDRIAHIKNVIQSRLGDPGVQLLPPSMKYDAHAASAVRKK